MKIGNKNMKSTLKLFMNQTKEIEMKTIKKNLLIIKSIMFLTLLSGCANTLEKIPVSEGMRPTLANYNPPEWVLKGSGAFTDSKGNVIWGVSSVSGVKNAALQRIAADDRARNSVAKIFKVHSKSLSKDLLAHAMTGNLEATSEEQGIETGIKTGVEQVLRGVMIVDHWEHPGRNELFSLARLDLKQFKNLPIMKNLNRTSNLKEKKLNNTESFPETTKESIKNSADKFFENMN
jgi:hypothetical protein